MNKGLFSSPVDCLLFRRSDSTFTKTLTFHLPEKVLSFFFLLAFFALIDFIHSRAWNEYFRCWLNLSENGRPTNDRKFQVNVFMDKDDGMSYRLQRSSWKCNWLDWLVRYFVFFDHSSSLSEPFLNALKKISLLFWWKACVEDVFLFSRLRNSDFKNFEINASFRIISMFCIFFKNQLKYLIKTYSVETFRWKQSKM